MCDLAGFLARACYVVFSYLAGIVHVIVMHMYLPDAAWGLMLIPCLRLVAREFLSMAGGVTHFACRSSNCL